MIPKPFIRERDGADALVEGSYLIRRAGRVDVPVRVWFGAPLDETGQELDRSPRWQVQVGFQLLEQEPVVVGGIRIVNLDDIWPACARLPIDKDEWKHRLERAEWAAEYDPDDAHAEIGGRVDPMTARLP